MSFVTCITGLCKVSADVHAVFFQTMYHLTYFVIDLIDLVGLLFFVGLFLNHHVLFLCIPFLLKTFKRKPNVLVVPCNLCPLNINKYETNKELPQTTHFVIDEVIFTFVVFCVQFFYTLH